VIIPTHNRKQKLTSLLQSIALQSFDYRYFEIIVVATANDPAYEVQPPESLVPNYRIVTIPSDPTKGRSASAKRNYGAEQSHAPWLAMIDDDCVADSEWLANALKIIEAKQCSGIEGHTIIPTPEKKTLTYKGIQRLSRPGGYQTCNIFYKKEDFINLGGFDLNFPFYLEDTDWAWTLLESGKKIAFGENVKVQHPVPEPEPQRLLQNAIRMRKLPYLAKKHPETYKHSKMRAYPRPYALLVLFDILCFAFLTLMQFQLAFLFLGARLLITLAYIVRLFLGQHWTIKEVSATFFYTCIGPIIGLFQLMRGNWEQRTFLFLR